MKIFIEPSNVRSSSAKIRTLKDESVEQSIAESNILIKQLQAVTTSKSLLCISVKSKLSMHYDGLKTRFGAKNVEAAIENSLFEIERKIIRNHEWIKMVKEVEFLYNQGLILIQHYTF